MLKTTISAYNGYEQHTFTCAGHEGTLILPHTPLKPGNRWIWRAEFLGAFDSVDRMLLERGWCLAYLRVSDMYGCPQAVEWMEEFRRLVVNEWDLCEKTVLEGFSRGGLYACNFALTHPDKVSCLYLDAPVLGIRNWPAGLGTYPRWGGEEWEQCKRWYGVTDESILTFDRDPLDRFDELLDADIPVVLICGLKDQAVYFPENGQKLIDAYQRRDGKLMTVLKPDCDHHPHSVEDPTAVCDFIESVTA
ncbi:MAG: alpha/beta hydrolase family protein [Acutalibacteraceae bacterium]|jgi:pimeloyl-ACP methyl ester carboxylesterase